jgi:peptidyl-prolyl cis-trans isomerase B (cyclophilin B)
MLCGCGSSKYASGLHHVEIDVQDYGTISLELDADTAPISVENFCSLAEDGFYNGLTFHRVISGFMIQGGDPKGNGSGGSDKTITGEFSENGVANDISHVRGTISMARSGDYDSASSQFFIVQQDSTYLDGQYAAFGHVTSGMEIVDAICADTPVEDSNGTVYWWNQPVITEIRVLD